MDSHIQWDEKIFIEPDLGDQRRSTFKALPAPPKTPKRVMMKYRFSGVFPFVLSLATFILTLVVVLAGQDIATFRGQYLIAVNTSAVGQNVIVFGEAEAISTSDLAGKLSDNLSNASVDLTNELVLQDKYYFYLQKVCFGSHAASDSRNTSKIQVENCRGWEEIRKNVTDLSKSLNSSIVVGKTHVTGPLLAELASSTENLLDNLNRMLRAVLAFLIITLIGSILSTISIVPAAYFPHSRLLIYFNILWSGLASVCAFVAAILLSAVFVLTGIMVNFSNTVGIQIERGWTVLLLLWLSSVFAGLSLLYWIAIWFVETRTSSFVRRHRNEDEVGHWGGICKEVWRDINGRRRSASTGS